METVINAAKETAANMKRLNPDRRFAHSANGYYIAVFVPELGLWSPCLWSLIDGRWSSRGPSSINGNLIADSNEWVEV